MDQKKIIDTCKEIELIVKDEITAAAYEWLSRHPKYDHIAAEIADQAKEDEDSVFKIYSLFYLENQVDSYSFQKTYSSKKYIHEVIEDNQDKLLSEKAIELLTLWQKQPPKWMFFTVTECIHDNLYHIEDVFGTGEHTMYSPLLTILFEDTIEQVHILALTYHNGSCLQHYGIVRPYNLTSQEISYFCRSLDARSYATNGLSGCILKNFIDFFALDLSYFNEAPHLDEDEDEGFSAWGFGEMELSHLDLEALPGEWDIETSSSGIKRYSYLGPDDYLLSVDRPDEIFPKIMEDEFWEYHGVKPPTLYIDAKENRIVFVVSHFVDVLILGVVMANSITAADPGEYLSKTWTIISDELKQIMTDTLALHMPWDTYEYEFLKDNDQRFKSLNNIMQRIMDSTNKGKPFDFSDIDNSDELDKDAISEIINKVNSIVKDRRPELELTDEDRAYELKDFIQPPPFIKLQMSHSLTESSLFKIHDTPEVFELYRTFSGASHASAASPGKLSEFIEDIFFDLFDSSDNHILNSLLYVLLIRKNEWTSVRSIAIEQLKMFHHVFIPVVAEDNEDFFTTMSSVVHRELGTRGLVELNQRPKGEQRRLGTYSIKPSPVLTSLVELQNLI